MERRVETLKVVEVFDVVADDVACIFIVDEGAFSQALVLERCVQALGNRVVPARGDGRAAP